MLRWKENYVENTQKKCITVTVVGDFEGGKILYMEPDWTFQEFLNASSHRLSLHSVATRAFNVDGVEIDDCMMIEDNDMIFLSAGEDFVIPMLASDSNDKNGGKESELIPSIVGGYKVSRFLGRGGFGEVRVGIHQLTGEQVALKFLRKSDIMSIGAAERTATEIQCLSTLKHQNIIRLQQHVETPNHLVLVFELMEGGDLLHYLIRRGKTAAQIALTEDEARPLFHQIVSGISYAHNQHICHRDLKLENILLKGMSLAYVKIADFGLSDFYRPGSTMKSNCGTISFLAPEVFRGTSNAGPPLDVWSLGVILFAVLCGRLPFEGSELSSNKRPRDTIIRARILKCQYKIDEQLGPEVKDLVRRMLKLDPEERASVPEIFNHCWMRSTHSSVHLDSALSPLPVAMQSNPSTTVATNSWTNPTICSVLPPGGSNPSLPTTPSPVTFPLEPSNEPVEIDSGNASALPLFLTPQPRVAAQSVEENNDGSGFEPLTISNIARRPSLAKVNRYSSGDSVNGDDSSINDPIVPLGMMSEHVTGSNNTIVIDDSLDKMSELPSILRERCDSSGCLSGLDTNMSLLTQEKTSAGSQGLSRPKSNYASNAPPIPENEVDTNPHLRSPTFKLIPLRRINPSTSSPFRRDIDEDDDHIVGSSNSSTSSNSSNTNVHVNINANEQLVNYSSSANVTPTRRSNRYANSSLKDDDDENASMSSAHSFSYAPRPPSDSRPVTVHGHGSNTQSTGHQRNPRHSHHSSTNRAPKHTSATASGDESLSNLEQSIHQLQPLSPIVGVVSRRKTHYPSNGSNNSMSSVSKSVAVESGISELYSDASNRPRRDRQNSGTTSVSSSVNGSLLAGTEVYGIAQTASSSNSKAVTAGRASLFTEKKSFMFDNSSARKGASSNSNSTATQLRTYSTIE